MRDGKSFKIRVVRVFLDLTLIIPLKPLILLILTNTKCQSKFISKKKKEEN